MRFGPINHLILFGGGARLLACLDLAQARGFRVEVVSAPRLLNATLDDGSGTVAAALRTRGVPTADVENLEVFDIHAHVTLQTMGISFGAPWIFRHAQIDAFGGRLLNAHGTCLPENRGGATFSWQILREDHRGAFLFHQVDTGVDAGPIVAMESYTFPDSCRTPADYRAYHLAREPLFLARFLDRIRNDDDFLLAPQDASQSTYFPRLATIHHAYIDWSWRAEEIVRFIAAFDRPCDGAMTFLRGAGVLLRDAETTTRDGTFHPFMRGLVIRKHDHSIAVAALGGTVIVRGIYRLDDGGDAYPNIRPGHRLITPRSVLDDALTYEAVYDARGLCESERTTTVSEKAQVSSSVSR